MRPMFHKATSAPTNFKPRRSALNILSRSLWHGQVRRVVTLCKTAGRTFRALLHPRSSCDCTFVAYVLTFLYFSDPPGTPLANDILVNDIDLIVQLQKRAYMYNPNLGISTMVDVIEVTSRSDKRFFQQMSLLRTFLFLIWISCAALPWK